MNKTEFLDWYESTIDPIVEVDGEDRRRTAFRRMYKFIAAAVEVSDERRVKAWIKRNAKSSQGRVSPSGYFLSLIDNGEPPQSKAKVILACHQRYVSAPEVQYPQGRPLMADLLARHKRGEDLDAYMATNFPCTVLERNQ